MNISHIYCKSSIQSIKILYTRVETTHWGETKVHYFQGEELLPCLHTSNQNFLKPIPSMKAHNILYFNEAKFEIDLADSFKNHLVLIVTFINNLVLMKYTTFKLV